MQRIKDGAKEISHILQWERVQGDSCVSGSDDVRTEALLARVSYTSSGEDFGVEPDEYKPTLKRCWGQRHENEDCGEVQDGESYFRVPEVGSCVHMKVPCRLS